MGIKAMENYGYVLDFLIFQIELEKFVQAKLQSWNTSAQGRVDLRNVLF